MRLWLKLLLSFLVIIGATVMISVAGIRSAKDVRDSFQRVNDEPVPHLLALKDLRYAGLRIISSSMEYAFIIAIDSDGTQKSGGEELVEQKQEEKRLIKEGRDQFQKSLSTCRRFVSDDAASVAQHQRIEQAGTSLLAASDHYLHVVDAHRPANELLTAKEAFEGSEKDFLEAVTVAHDEHLHALDRYVRNVFSRVSKAITSAGLLSFIAITGSVLLSVALSRHILRRIRSLNDAACQVAAGRRDVHVAETSNDEITSVSVSFNRMIATLRDYETTLDSTNRYLDSIITTMPEALTVVSVDGSILDINRATGDILGFDKSQLVGRKFSDLFNSLEEGVEFVRTVTTGNAHIQREAVLVTRDGEEIYVTLSARMLESKDVRDRFICLSHDITRRKLAEKEVHNLAYFDQLTGLANRTLFFDRCAQALAHAKRHRELFAILFFDLDHFKDINDTMGHDAGDQLLQAVVKRFQTIVRASDTFARLGGDEFALLCTSLADPSAAAKVADKLLATIKHPFDIAGRQIYSGASIGIVVFPEDGDDIASLLKNADLAMYAAKSAGGNRYQYFSSELNTKAQERATIEEALRTALQRNELSLHYQPQIDIVSGKVIGMEALARWNHPTLGSIPPDNFIPIAEQTGLIKELGEWVLRTACQQCKKWHQLGHGITISVNVSMLQLMNMEFTESVVRMLHEVGLEPRYLDLELTESMLMDKAAVSVEILRRLKSLGVKISIDDFGTGYSSLSYLKNFSIDRIKIDRSFVRDVTSRSDATGIVKAIVAIGHSMGLSVIAEGVESVHEEEKLIQCGCDEVQGFYYGRPMAVTDAEEYLSNSKLPNTSRCLPHSKCFCSDNDRCEETPVTAVNL